MNIRHVKRCLLILALLLISSLAHAEGGCPPGMIPYSGTDISSCGPIPQGYNRPQGHWEDRWAAEASGDDGTLGLASDQLSEEDAKQASTENCQTRGGVGCKVEVTYKNGCIAIINGTDETGGGHSTVATAGTLKEAIKEGIKVCKTWGKDSCELFRTTCGLPKWVNN